MTSHTRMNIDSLLKQHSFIKELFNAIPCGVLVINSKRIVYAVNNGLKNTYGINRTDIGVKRPGDILGCINAFIDKKGCGFSEACNSCAVRKTAIEAVSGNRISRRKIKVQLMVNGEPKEFVLLVSAAPFDYDGERFAIIMLEDTTELNVLRKRLKEEHSFRGIVSCNHIMQDVFETVRDVADSTIPVLIQGESGTGKELIASALHNESPRANMPFVPINCAALPESLLESELFGYVKGAFTGAVRNKKGRFELAHGGTLFLDEIGDMPPLIQAKLLRVIQDGKVEPVGSEKSISVDVRIISATNKVLKDEIKKGNFREDLYYRLNVLPINLPPLRKRKDDIPLLVEYFLNKATKKGQKVKNVSPEALACMMDYNWPGNVRELQNTIRFALIKCKGQTIKPGDLPIELIEHSEGQTKKGSFRKLDEDSVRAALIQTGGNKAKAARLLGVGRATLYRFLSD